MVNLMASGREDEAGKKRRLAEFKIELQKKIEEAEADLGNLKILLGFVNEILLEKGFKRAEIPRFKQAKKRADAPVEADETVVPLKTSSGELLAILSVGQDSIRVKMADDKVFDVKTPPFRQFLVDRVLEKMVEKDSEALGKDAVPLDERFSYDLVLDGDVVREILVKHATVERVRELKSSIRWTLEKMHEKAKG